MTKIEIVRPLWLNVLIDAGPKTWPSFRGLYLAKSFKGRWIACDNSTSECWVEEFTDGKEAAAWLLREDAMSDKQYPTRMHEVLGVWE